MSIEQPINSNAVIDWASELAASLLAPLGKRWLHIQGVVERARWAGSVFDETDRSYLIAAAYFHDIGYALSLQRTGFHPLDGAYYLQSFQQDRLVSLVAYYSGAQFEAHLHGLTPELLQFTRDYSALDDALTYCDMITNSTGSQVTFEQRIADIFQRYDETHIVHRAIQQAVPSLSAAVRRTEQILMKHGILKGEE
jgi:HD domain